MLVGCIVLAVCLWITLADKPRTVAPDDWQFVRTCAKVAPLFVLITWLSTYVRARLRSDPRRKGSSYLTPTTSIYDQLLLESAAMARYAVKDGIVIDAEKMALVNRLRCNPPDGCQDQSDQVVALTEAHQHLAERVRPATPHTLALLAYPPDKNPLFSWLGNVRLVRMLVGLTAVLLPLFTILAVTAGPDITSIDKLFAQGPFLQRFFRVSFLLVAAALGATFAALRKAFRFIGNLSYDEKYESSYWIRVVQGITSGLVLSVLLANLFFTEDKADATVSATAGASTAVQAAVASTAAGNPQFRITLPLLAFVGGFSEDLVFSILRRIIDALRTLVTGTLEDRVEDQKASLAAENRLQEVTTQQEYIGRMFRMKASIPATDTAAHAEIDKAIAEALGTTAAAARASASRHGGDPSDGEDGSHDDGPKNDGPQDKGPDGKGPGGDGGGSPRASGGSPAGSGESSREPAVAGPEDKGPEHPSNDPPVEPAKDAGDGQGDHADPDGLAAPGTRIVNVQRLADALHGDLLPEA